MRNEKIKVLLLGIGTGSNHALAYFKNNSKVIQELVEFDYLAIDTDKQALCHLNFSLRQKIYIKEDIKNIGNDKGKTGVLEYERDIETLLKNREITLLVIFACMGGQTVTGGSVEIVKLTQKLNIPTITIASLPFIFEGAKRLEIANAGIENLKSQCNSLIIISSDLVIKRNIGITIANIFNKLNEAFAETLCSIITIFSEKQYLSIDLQKLTRVLNGTSLVISEHGTGDTPLKKTMERIFQFATSISPNIVDAKAILLYISYNERDVTLEEMSAIHDFLKLYNKNIDIKWDLKQDTTIDGAKVTVIISNIIEDNIHVSSDEINDYVIGPKIPLEIADIVNDINNEYPGKKAFIIMQFGKTPNHNAILNELKQTLKENGITALRADDKEYTEDLLNNILAYIYACDFSIAIFERLSSDVFNPNVALEIGIMMGLNKQICLLKDKNILKLNSDLAGKLYREFDVYDPHNTIPPVIVKWLKDKKIIEK